VVLVKAKRAGVVTYDKRGFCELPQSQYISIGPRMVPHCHVELETSRSKVKMIMI
jgi:hypothetical protein